MQRPKMTRVISFRVTDPDWFAIQNAADQIEEAPNEWCRIITLETVRLPAGLTRHHRILFAQMARTGFLVENGFQLLADETLESEHWKRYRAYAKANLTAITDRALVDVLLEVKHGVHR
jgi:hypothetical protein